MIDVQEVKQKILKLLDEKGPSLPMHLSKDVQLSTIFTSAILAELIHEKKVILSKLRIGSSHLYLLPGQEKKLEDFSDNLGGMEKDAFLILREKKVLEDEKQTPAIRVALRAIKDFATPLRYQEKIIWKYTFSPNEEIQEILKNRKPTQPEVQTHQVSQMHHAPQMSQPPREELPREPIQAITERPAIEQKVENELERVIETIEKTEEPQTQRREIEPIFERPIETKVNVEKSPKIKDKKSINFLEEIRAYLYGKNIEMLNTLDIKKDEITAIIKQKERKHLLVAYNRKRVTERDILKAYKKAQSLNLPYYILFKGSTTKKMLDTINAYKQLLEIDSLEQ